MAKNQESCHLEQKTIWEDSSRASVTCNDLGREYLKRRGVSILKMKRETESFSLIRRSKDMKRFAGIYAFNEKYRRHSNLGMKLL